MIPASASLGASGGSHSARDRLAHIEAPTLILHSRGDQMVEMDAARDLVAVVSGARIQSLDSDNHSLIDREPASQDYIRAVLDFIRENAA